MRIHRFVEVSAIAIRDAKGKAKHRIIVEHGTKAKQTIVSNTQKMNGLPINCTWCVSTGADDTCVLLIAITAS